MLLTAATLMYKPFLPVLIRNGWESFRDTFHQLKLFTVIMDKIFTYFSYTGIDSLHGKSQVKRTRLLPSENLRFAARLRILGHQEISIKYFKCLDWKASPHLVTGNEYFDIWAKKLQKKEREREREETSFQYIVQDCTICHSCTNLSYSN